MKETSELWDESVVQHKIMQKWRLKVEDGRETRKNRNIHLTVLLQHCLFKSLLDELDAAYGDLVLHAGIRWLSRGKVLQRFADLLPEIKSLLESKNEEQFDDAWLLDFGFLMGITAKLNELNYELQGKDKDMRHNQCCQCLYGLSVEKWEGWCISQT